VCGWYLCKSSLNWLWRAEGLDCKVAVVCILVETMTMKQRGSRSSGREQAEDASHDVQEDVAVKKLVIGQLTLAMQERELTKSQLATLLKTSRSQVDRLLDPARDVTLSTLQRAAALVGRKIKIQLI
jgi:antitoxin HicB